MPKIDTVVQFSGLKLGRYDYEYTLDGTFFEAFENEELRDGKVDFAVVLEKRERMLLFDFVFQGKVYTACDRCLGELEVPVAGEQALCVKFSDTDTSDDEDVVILPEGAYQIDLAQWMYEYVAVSLPIQKVHPEGGCDPEMLKYINADEDECEEGGDGLQQGQRAEGETDPRWDALKQLMEK